jgi:hypothetical protein
MAGYLFEGTLYLGIMSLTWYVILSLNVDGSNLPRSGVLDGVQYSTSPAADSVGSPASESDDTTGGSTKGSRTQPPVHIEVTQEAYCIYIQLEVHFVINIFGYKDFSVREMYW